MASLDPIAFIRDLPPDILAIVEGVAALTIIAALYVFLSRYINRAGKRLDIDEHNLNSMRLVLRVLTILLASSVLFSIFELPTELFVGGSALVGAIVGFGSSQTINNVAAGFYVILSRPFRIKDYVKIGDIEGQVEEIAINYTKLYTPTFNTLLIPNTQIMSNRILNCTREGSIEYAFSVTVPHSDVPNETIERRCVEPAIDDFMSKHGDEKLRRPEYLFDSSVPLGRSFRIRIFVPRGEAKRLYSLQPELYGYILDRWDREKANIGSKKV